MNFFGLARRSVFRKPIKSILLLLIVFAISTLLLAGVASKNASIEVQDKTRQAIGAGFLLERNAEYRTKRVREYSEKIGNDKEGSFGGYHQEKEIINGVETWSGWTTNEFESLDIKDIEKLAKTKGIADYNITTATTPVNPVNFKRIEDKDVDQSVDEGGVSLIGNKDMKLDRNVLSGNLHIKEGRMITPEDKDMCVISEELANQNNLKIGDKISFNDYHDTENSKVSEAEIVGIYQKLIAGWDEEYAKYQNDLSLLTDDQIVKIKFEYDMSTIQQKIDELDEQWKSGNRSAEIMDQ